MATYIVTYDLNKETLRPPIVGEVRKTPSVRLSESSYAIYASETVTQVHARFAKHLDPDDTFYVISLSRPWCGWGPSSVSEWLTKAVGLPSNGAQHVRRAGAPPRPLKAPPRTRR